MAKGIYDFLDQIEKVYATRGAGPRRAGESRARLPFIVKNDPAASTSSDYLLMTAITIAVARRGVVGWLFFFTLFTLFWLL